MEQRTGIAATTAIVAAIVSFIVLFTGHPIWGLVISIFAVLLGVAGLIMSASPRVSGGLLSILAMVLGAIGLVFSILGTVGAILT